MPDEESTVEAEATAEPDQPVEAPQGAGEPAGGELSIEDAFAAAKAELAASEEAGDTHAGQGDGEGEPPSEQPESTPASGVPAQQEPQAATETREPQTAQGALDRILTLAKQGRLAELTPAEKGTYNALRQQYGAEQEREEQFLDFYLQLQTLKQEDPEAYVSEIEQKPELIRFQQLYKQEHPDISLDNPHPRGKPEHVVRQQVNSEWEDHLGGTAAAIAKEAGVSPDRFKEIAEKADGAIGTMLASVVTEAVKVRAEAEAAKRLEAALKDERAAIRAEIETEMAQKHMVRFPAGGTPEDPKARKPSTGDLWQDAHREAKEALGELA